MASEMLSGDKNFKKFVRKEVGLRKHSDWNFKFIVGIIRKSLNLYWFWTASELSSTISEEEVRKRGAEKIELVTAWRGKTEVFRPRGVFLAAETTSWIFYIPTFDDNYNYFENYEKRNTKCMLGLQTSQLSNTYNRKKNQKKSADFFHGVKVIQYHVQNHKIR